MCQNSANGQVHLWYPDRSKPNKSTFTETEVLETSEVAMALKAYEEGGASLYFQGPVDFREKFCKQLAYQLGMNFSSYLPDFSSMSDIEVFVSKAGGLTNYHTDSQENFTVQLDGVKKWRLIKSSKGKKDNSKIENSNWDEVVIEPGDILYYPAGFTHSVECIQDS